jgi:hypothetical protein
MIYSKYLAQQVTSASSSQICARVFLLSQIGLPKIRSGVSAVIYGNEHGFLGKGAITKIVKVLFQ